MILLLHIKQYRNLANMLKPVKPRGDTSVAFVRLGCTSANWHRYFYMPRNTPSGLDIVGLDHSSKDIVGLVQMCSICNAGTLLASVKAWINLTDCHPAINDRVCQIVLFALLQSMVHIVHEYIVYFQRM